MQFTAILAVLAAAVATQAAVIGVTTPLGLASPLEKRLTCSLPNGETWCLANCYAQGFCDSYCSAKKICICEGKKSNLPTCGKI